MTAPLPQDLRRRLVQAVEEGSSRRAAAAQLGVSHSAAVKLMRRVRETGSTMPARTNGPRKRLLMHHEALLRELVSTRQRITLDEIRCELRARGIQVRSLTTIWRTLKRLGLSSNKGSENE